MIKHIVLWKLKESSEGKSKAENIQIMKSMLEGLPAKTGGCIRTLEVGVNLKDSAESADITLYSEFNSLEDLERYTKHPEHMKVAEFIGKVRSERRVMDYSV